MQITALILTYNRADFIGTCINSMVREMESGASLHIVVMDNGASDDTPQVLAEVKKNLPMHCTLQAERTEDNRPVPGVINRGLRICLQRPADYLVFLNDDTEFTPGSFRALLAANEAHPLAILTPLQRSYRQPEHLDANAYEHVVECRELVEDALMRRPLADAYAIRTIIGACMVARLEVWRTVGLFDELFWFYGVDDDFCKRAQRLGHACMLAPGAHLLHAHGKLGAREEEQTKEGHRDKWRKETQARYWFCLKNPDRAFPAALFDLTRMALTNAFSCLAHAWPWGAMHSLFIYLWFLGRLPQLAAARRRDFPGAGQ